MYEDREQKSALPLWVFCILSCLDRYSLVKKKKAVASGWHHSTTTQWDETDKHLGEVV